MSWARSSLFEVVFCRLSDFSKVSDIVFTNTNFFWDSGSCVLAGFGSSSKGWAKGLDVGFFEYYKSKLYWSKFIILVSVTAGLLRTKSRILV